jgi:hypothetical protein
MKNDIDIRKSAVHGVLKQFLHAGSSGRMLPLHQPCLINIQTI